MAGRHAGVSWQNRRMQPATNQPSTDGLSDLVQPQRLTSVVDIGANPIDGEAPYKAMLQRGLCQLIGFDPQPDALTRLNARKTELETYLPYAVGDGDAHSLKVCRGIGFASLLQPDEKALTHFPRFSELGRVVSDIKLTTRRLDDIAEIKEIDFLKIRARRRGKSAFRFSAIAIDQCEHHARGSLSASNIQCRRFCQRVGRSGK